MLWEICGRAEKVKKEGDVVRRCFGVAECVDCG